MLEWRSRDPEIAAECVAKGDNQDQHQGAGDDGTHIKLTQGKTGARVVIKVGAPLKAALDAAPKRSTIILTNSDNKPWTSDGFRASWGKACKAAGVVGVTFNDLRGTAVTRRLCRRHTLLRRWRYPKSSRS
jgi:hypothetical protein